MMILFVSFLPLKLTPISRVYHRLHCPSAQCYLLDASRRRVAQHRNVGIAFQASYGIFQSLALLRRRCIPPGASIYVEEGPAQPHHRRLEGTRRARARLVKHGGQDSMTQTVVAADGAHQRSHGLGGLEEEEESRWGDLSDRDEMRVQPCFRIISERVRADGSGGRIGHCRRDEG